MSEPSILMRREPLPRAQLDALLARYAQLAVKSDARSRRAAVRVRNEIIESNMRLVAMVAKRFRLPTGLEVDDLLAYGVPGLVTAVERFDLARGVCFSTYAAWWIRHEISRSLADCGSTIRVPVHAAAAAYDGRMKEDARAAKRMLSLDVPIHSEDGPRTWVATPGEFIDPADAIDAAHARTAVSEQLDTLPERQRFVLAGRLEGLTLTEVGKRLEGGRSRERVRQLEQEAFAMLRPRLMDVADLASA